MRANPRQYAKAISHIQKAGFTWVVGAGLYSKVISNPNRPDLGVIKICNTIDNWPRYIAWATRNGYAGNCAPYVHWLRTFDGFYVAYMERLSHTVNDSNRDTKFYVRLLKSYVEDDELEYPEYSESCCPWNEERHYGFLKFLDDFRSSFATEDNHWDLHLGNFMLDRGENRLILTDPLQSRSSTAIRIKKGTVASECIMED